MNEVFDTLKSLKRNKAMGCDNMPPQTDNYLLMIGFYVNRYCNSIS